MAKRTSKSKNQVRSSFIGMSLVDVELSYSPELEEPENLGLNYGALVTRPTEASENTYIFQCDVMIEKTSEGNEELRTAIEAKYLCAMGCTNATDEEVLSLARRYAQTTVWGNFSSLAAILVQQMNAQFILLPPAPHSVGVADDEDKDE